MGPFSNLLSLPSDLSGLIFLSFAINRACSFCLYLKDAQIITKKSTDVQEIIRLCRHQSDVSAPLVVQHSLNRYVIGVLS